MRPPLVRVVKVMSDAIATAPQNQETGCLGISGKTALPVVMGWRVGEVVGQWGKC